MPCAECERGARRTHAFRHHAHAGENLVQRSPTSELDPDTPHPIIDLMADQRTQEKMGGTMRLGAYTCHLTEGGLARAAYGTTEVAERQRHR